MSINSKTVVLTILFSTAVAAQFGGEGPTTRAIREAKRTEIAFQTEKRDAGRARQERFLRRVRAFVNSWNSFAKDYNQGEFNLRKAIRASKAFHALEHSGGWPQVKARQRRKEQARKPR